MFYEALHQKYNDYNKMREQVDAMGVYCPEDLDKSTRNLLLALVFLVIVYLGLFMAGVYYAFRCSMIKKWNPYTPVMLILLFMIPKIGGLFLILTIGMGAATCGIPY